MSGTLRTATTLKGGDPVPEVFVTLYRVEQKARINEATMETMLKKADGTFYQDDPLPTTPDARLVIGTGDERWIMFAINRNGQIKYRGVREFSNGLFEYENRKGASGSFMNKKLASELLEQIGKNPH